MAFWNQEDWTQAGKDALATTAATAAGAAGVGFTLEGLNRLGSNDAFSKYDEDRNVNENLPTYLGYTKNYWGGDPNAAGNYTQLGLNGLASTNSNRDWFMNQAALGAGTAKENAALSNQEAYGAGYDQAGSMQLAREAAMGLAPSEAAYQMQHGLDQAIGSQYAATGGARGAAGIAMAQGNMGANIANLQQNAYTNAGALRAREMNDARTLYNNASNTNRAQDQNRLQIGNAMASGNAGQYNQFIGQMGSLGNQADSVANQWYGSSMSPYNSQLGADVTGTGQGLDLFNSGAGRKYGVEATNAAARSDAAHGYLNAGGTALTVMGNLVGSASGSYNPTSGTQTNAKTGAGIGGSSTGDFDPGGKYDPGY